VAQLSSGIKVTRVMSAVAAGVTTPQTSTAVDMAGFQGVRFIVLLGVGSASSIGQVKATQADTAAGSPVAFTDIAGSAGTAFTPTTDDNKVWILDIYRPARRFVKCVVIRGVGNTVIDGIIAEQYGPTKLPKTDDTTTVLGRSLLVSPADGTA
jgi:hypothetical protein